MEKCMLKVTNRSERRHVKQQAGGQLYKRAFGMFTKQTK